MTDLQRTPLFDSHKRLGAKLVPFAGWEMPVQYPAGIIAEHNAVRSNVGIFDVSHMGEFEVTGPDRNAFVNRVTCNDVSALEPGGVQYSGLLTREGTFIDDCTVYRFDDKLMIVVNASNIEAAWEHIVEEKKGAVLFLRHEKLKTAAPLLFCFPSDNEAKWGGANRVSAMLAQAIKAGVRAEDATKYGADLQKANFVSGGSRVVKTSTAGESTGVSRIFRWERNRAEVVAAIKALVERVQKY